MPEAIAPINATSTSTTPAPKPVVVDAKKPVEAKKPPTFKSKVEETLWRVNEPTADEVEDTKSMSDIIDKAQADAAKTSKEANAGLEIHDDKKAKPATPPPPDPSTAAKEKLKVGDKEFELDGEQIRRWAQKGINYELKNRDTAASAAAVQAREQAVAAKEAETAQLLAYLQDGGSLEMLEELHGPQKARQLVENYLRPKIEREMLPEGEQELLTTRERAERAEARLQQLEQQEQQTVAEKQQKGFEQEYQKYIIDALDKGGFPKGADLTPFARDMASWMERGLSRGIEYTPERLVSLVKEDNNLRVGAITGTYVTQIEQAKEKGDLQSVVKYGEQLVEILGEPVMYAIGKYHLAKMQGQQPQVPKQIFDTPKVAAKQEKKRPYMSEDEYAAERRRRVEAMERGEAVPDWD